MKWFFIAVIALLAASGNAAIFDSHSYLSVIGGFAFNLFILSLFFLWWASYFSGAIVKIRLFVIAHAITMLAVGIGIFIIGTNIILENTCNSLIFINKSQSFLGQFSNYVESLGYCRELGYGIVLLSIFIAYPSIKLFAGILGHSSAQPDFD